MRIFLFMLSALIALQAPEPAAAMVRAAWAVTAHDEQVLPARHNDVVQSAAQKRVAPSVRPSTQHAPPPQPARLAQPSAYLIVTPAVPRDSIPRLRPHAYDATGPPTAA